MKPIYTRLLALLLCIGLMLVFVACRENEMQQDDNDNSDREQNGNAVVPDNKDKEDSGDQNITPPIDNKDEPPSGAAADNGDAQQTPPDQDEPIVIPPPQEVTRVTDYSTRVAADELILHNGIKLGMSYAEVVAYSGYPGKKPQLSVAQNAQTRFRIEWGGIEYWFSCYSVGGKMQDEKLVSISINSGAFDASIFRNIKIGDSVENVISKLPATDPVPKMWKEQYLYEYEEIEPKGVAVLRYVMTDVFSNYELDIYNSQWWVEIVFWRESQTVRQINITLREN